MNKLECHSGTSYEEIMKFINNNIGKTIKFHYEIKGYTTWGNDEVDEIELNANGLAWINSYLGSKEEYRNNSAYVHNIEVIK